MSFSVNTNLDALTAYNALAKVNAETTKAQLRLTTLKRINQVADDTSGFKVGKELEAENMKMQAQLANISSGKNWLSTGESALMLVNDKLNQIAAKQEDSKDPLKDATSLQNDIQTLANEIDSILSNTNINGTDVLADAIQSFGAGASTVQINIGGQIGDNSTSLTALQAGDAGSLTEDISTFQDNIKTALGYIGNTTQTLDSREEYVTASISNNAATISRLFDANIALEQLSATKGQIGGQIGTAMLAQLNTQPQNVLSLFR